MSIYTMTRSSIRGIIHGVCRAEVTGLENVPKEGGFIVASNHLSFFDSLIIQALTPRDVAFFAKAEYFTTPGLKGKMMKTFFESVGSIPVQRGEQAASVAALDSLVEIVENGSGIGIYPEGTRSRDGKLYRGRTGVGWLALTTGVPVVPVGLIGTEKLQPAGSKGFRPAKFHIHYGEPLYFDQLGRKHPLPQRRQATDRIVDAIAELSGQERVDSYNQLPPDAK
ncbi:MULTISPECIES: lysophospholipid acyltransferase family protein [Glutamicibacter]|jgi:1-acyl-sn-glycerol-3-phosphate acyltransferase|uniref:1-acyl-sn-glycerol-3-phosphate acyltransferase n=3 Tax=Glutamicibacter arilaitensis TaxID=256701 RepID=A0A2N7S3K0_9MICC|nr:MULTISPECIES: lysophospholipid acyltransferase family protein [Glutamicibacter]PMQ20705.1 1-acyl-sn-glycerol-3-phosphate acyltransferase [Glutamicibacter arilaitensis]TFH56944.1 1-acyl-sn-glycerol-3-phosphate acyltransferase [Glutamicibacter arilaitensis]CBT76127.1 putative 1-acylglycerol-3-phosphate O-acyltransferase [Glutamicibacter arilaitensis Re117]HCH47616.1 1-acyl-sn-glycerol-3-phosphate acyltransferase [Glutamicibacter sp.]HCJ54237.1 1-acyl-sn-glycerol-3-phosphate acyltransferase [G